MKGRQIFLLLFYLTSCSYSSNKEYDQRAVEALDELVETIGDLNACSYTLRVNRKEESDQGEMMEIYNEHDVYLQGPDKMYVYSQGDKGRFSYWYNGSGISIFRYDENTHNTIDVNGNLIKAIDHISSKHGIDIPAADFFYPTLTDDILDQFDYVYFKGQESLDGGTWTVVEASSSEEFLAIYIEPETNLPYRMYLMDSTGNSYDATFSNWRVDPELDETLFKFTPPPGSTEQEAKTAS